MFVVEMLNGKSYKRVAEKRSLWAALDAMSAAGRRNAGTYRVKQGKRVVVKRAYALARPIAA